MAVYKVLTSRVFLKQVQLGDRGYGPIYEWVFDVAPFEAKVQEALAKGATPVGGVSVTSTGDGVGQMLIYTQAVLFPQ